MNHLLTSLFLLIAFSSLTQENPDVRYVRYAQNETNEALYDTTDVYSFYAIASQTAEKVLGNYYTNGYDYQGIPQEKVDRLRSLYNGKVPGLEWELGRQLTSPIVNSFGEDSVLVLPDGTTEYIYPQRDTVYYLAGPFDDFVVREIKRLDPKTGKRLFFPEELILRRRLFPGEDPVPVASFKWDYLFSIDKERMVNIPAKKQAALMTEFTQYLSNAERRFGKDGCYQFFTFPNPQYYYYYVSESRKLKHAKEMSQVRAFLKMSEQEGVSIKTYTHAETLSTIYGEDSTFLDTRTGEQLIAFQWVTDSSFCVTSGFESLREIHTLSYEPLEFTWRKTVSSIVAIRTTSSGEPFIVYRITKEPLNPEYSSALGLSYLTYMYERMNNPLRKYLDLKTSETLSLHWPVVLERHAPFLGEVIRSPAG